MFYISGPNETLQSLMQLELVFGNLSDYERKFAAANPELCAKFPEYKKQIPPYTPLVLVSEEPMDAALRSEVLDDISRYNTDDRQKLRMMQENHPDVLTQIAMMDIMEELQDYASAFRKWLKVPLVITPWTEMNSSLTNKSLLKVFGETSKYSSDFIKTMPRFQMVDRLYEAMMARDTLNRELHLLGQAKDSMSLALKRELEKKIKDLTAEIKRELPKRILEKSSKYIHKRFSSNEIRQLRANSYSAKGARTGKLLTIRFDVLNKLGLGRLRILIKGLKILGKGINKMTTVLNYAVVAYDTGEALLDRRNRDAFRTFLTGAGAVYATSQLVSAIGGTSALGGYVLGAVVGDVTIGATILVCSPLLGWVVLIIAGIGVGGYIGYKVKGILEEFWDLSEEKGSYFYQEACKSTNRLVQEFSEAFSAGTRWYSELHGKNR